MSTEHHETFRDWLPVAVSWLGSASTAAITHASTAMEWTLNRAGAIAALVTVAYTVWQWWRQAHKDSEDRRAYRALLAELSEEYRDKVDTRPG